jgi:hypothetical protein
METSEMNRFSFVIIFFVILFTPINTSNQLQQQKNNKMFINK